MAALLEIRGLTKRFGGLVAVDDLSLDLGERGLVGLIGPNGAGKTTVFNLISGLYAPDSGTIVINRQNIAGHPPHEVARKGISRTFQNIRLFGSLSVLENVLIGSHLRSTETLAESLMHDSRQRARERQLRDQAIALLSGLGIERWKDVPARSLPYGEQRRLEIARALAPEPTVLLLDEPAAGLNTRETQELMLLLRRLRDERSLSIIVIEHDMRFVMGICETIYVLDYGRLIAAGPPDAIRSDPRVIEAYLGQAPSAPEVGA